MSTQGRGAYSRTLTRTTVPTRFIGLMSGTSMDGVDGVVLRCEGLRLQVTHARHTVMPDALRHTLLNLNTSGPDELRRSALAANELVRLCAQTVHGLLADAGLKPADIAAIGAHGQTVRHHPPPGKTTATSLAPWDFYTLQLNNPALLAELTGIAVVADFRSRDVASGGQGAPLVPAFHDAVFAEPGQRVAVVNIGGMANATLLDGTGSVSGFDTGPGNALLDLWCERHTGQRFDPAGAWAASGQPVPSLLQKMQQDGYFLLKGPRSTGRDHFNARWLERQLDGQEHSARDVQATLCELTAWSIETALPRDLHRVVVCGGGVFNTALIQRLAARLSPAPLLTSDELGIPAMDVEAAAFAWLARQTLSGLPGNVTQVTGAIGPRVLGAIYPA